MVCINSIVNVKQKQNHMNDFSISDVSVRELLQLIVDAGSVVYN